MEHRALSMIWSTLSTCSSVLLSLRITLSQHTTHNHITSTHGNPKNPAAESFTNSFFFCEMCLFFTMWRPREPSS